MKIFSTIRNVLDKIELSFFTLSAVSLVGLTVVAVFLRYVLSSPLAWCEEVQMILVVWLGFSGGSIAFRNRGHIAVDLLTNRFPKGLQKIVQILVWVLVMIAICWIFKLELDRTFQLFSTKQSTTVLQIPKYITYGAIVIMCAGMILNHLLNGIDDVRALLKGGADD